jgi:hypothetical protein
MVCCLFSFSVSGQYNPGVAGGSAGIDTTQLQPPSVLSRSIKIPANKGLNLGSSLDYALRQPGNKNSIFTDTLLIRNASYPFLRQSLHMKYVQIGVMYQHGLTNTIKTNYITSDKFHGWKLGYSTPFNFR